MDEFEDESPVNQVKPWRRGYEAQQLVGLPEGFLIRRTSKRGAFWGIFDADGWNLSQEYHTSADAAWQEFDDHYGLSSSSQSKGLFSYIVRAGG